MACGEEITRRNDKQTIWLTNNDTLLWLTKDNTSGAKLIDLMDTHTMAELKWWLLCRGIKAPNPWNKKKLVSRYQVANNTPINT